MTMHHRWHLGAFVHPFAQPIASQPSLTLVGYQTTNDHLVIASWSHKVERGAVWAQATRRGG
jgi:hypothetical protein